jgi:predicted ATPase
LLTLTGPGGIGKTRLALALAQSSKVDFEEGAAAVFLAPVRSVDQVSTKIATSMGLPVTASRSATEVVKSYLRSRQLLLLIDNFEHVVAAAPILAEFLEECPRVKVVVTSREMLRLSAEHVFQVPPLDVTPTSGGHAAAVELFLDRATAIRHDLPQSDDLVSAVAEICKRLDGLPLAIELAAARVRVLMPQEILARLDSRLGFLSSGASDYPERQRTLRSTIEWSYDLLTQHEQRLFECLSVFHGGFSLEAAEGVISDSPDLLEGLASLLDKSLIRSDAAVTEPRFTMLQTLREFAVERLKAQSDLEDVRRRHAQYFTDWVAGIVTDGREAETIRQMEYDSDNLRAAFGWLIENGDTGRVARAAAVVWKFWWVRSLFLEGIDWMERTRAAEGALSQDEEATIDFVIGMLAFGNADYPRSGEELAKATALRKELGDHAGAALASVCLGVIWRVEGNPAAEDLLRSAVDVLRESDDQWAYGFALFGLGRVILLDGRPGEAVSLLEESVEQFTETKSETLLAFVLVNLGWAQIALPDVEAARRSVRRGLEEGASIDNRDGMARAVEATAGVALTEGEGDRAAVLFGAAEGIRRSIGGVVWVPDRMTHVAIETTLRDRLGDPAFERLFEQGAGLTVREAVELALFREDGEVALSRDGTGAAPMPV